MFTQEYLKLLILQYFSAPKASAEITLLLGSWEKVYDFLYSFFDEFDLDLAYGHRLDIIGRIVGFSRIVPEAIAKEYFGFAGTLNALPFGEGKLFDLFKDVGYTSSQLDDNQYRFFIRAKIAKNVTSAYMISDDRVSLQDTIQYLFQGRAYIVDNKDMSLTIYVDESFNINDILYLQRLNLIPKPQAVNIGNIISYSTVATFGFSDNVNAVGFGQGVFASLIF
jgi:hypothetical protein